VIGVGNFGVTPTYDEPGFQSDFTPTPNE